VVSDSSQVVEADLQILESPARPNSHRQRIADWLAMRALEPEITLAEAAKRMGIAKSTLVTLIQRANKAGWLKFDDPLSRMEHEIVPKVVDGLKKLLDEGDRQTIIETAKGTIFKQYQDAKGLNTQQAQTILAIKFDIPTGEMVKQVASGVVVGRPRFIEGEVEDEQ
jgi:transposase